MVTESDQQVEQLRNLEQISEETRRILDDIVLSVRELDEPDRKLVTKYNQLFDYLLVLDADCEALGPKGWAFVVALERCKLDIKELDNFPGCILSNVSEFAVIDLNSKIEDKVLGCFNELADYLVELHANSRGMNLELQKLSQSHLNRARHYEELAKKDKGNYEGIRNDSGKALDRFLSKLLESISIDESYLVKLACHEEIKHILRMLINQWASKPELRNYHLKLLIDSCFSGNWVEVFQKIIIDYEFKGIEKFPKSIQFACGSDEEVDVRLAIKTIRHHKGEVI